MFPPEPTDAAHSRRSLVEFLRDALATATEFATLGEATFDAQSATKVRYLRPDELDAAPVPLPPGLLGPDRTAGGDAPGARVPRHPHRGTLQRPSRPRRPGAVLARPPVCTMPLSPARPEHRGDPARDVRPPAAPFAHRHSSRD